MRPAGRRPGNPDTHSEILSAAREVFGEVGYNRATIRAISQRAGIDPALIYHYFENKAKLYTASISLPFASAEAVYEVFSHDNHDAGRRLAALFFTVWEQEESRSSLLGILRSAMGGEDQAVTAFREYMVETLKERIAPQIEHPDAEMRALAVSSHLVGLAIIRYVVRVEPLASASIDEVVDLVSPRLQSYLD